MVNGDVLTLQRIMAKNSSLIFSQTNYEAQEISKSFPAEREIAKNFKILLEGKQESLISRQIFLKGIKAISAV